MQSVLRGAASQPSASGLGSPTNSKAKLDHSLSEVRRLFCEGRLIKAERGRENERRVVLLEEGVDDVEEASEVAILVLVTDRDEGSRDVRRHADSVLDVKALQIRIEEAVRMRGAK